MFAKLELPKSVGLDDIPGFVITGCSGISIPILRPICNLSLGQQYFTDVWKEEAILPVFIRCNYAIANKYIHISILDNSSKLFEFIIHEHVLLYVKLNTNKHGFT
jgi:hypothetical protein